MNLEKNEQMLLDLEMTINTCIKKIKGANVMM